MFLLAQRLQVGRAAIDAMLAPLSAFPHALGKRGLRVVPLLVRLLGVHLVLLFAGHGSGGRRASAALIRVGVSVARVSTPALFGSALLLDDVLRSAGLRVTRCAADVDYAAYLDVACVGWRRRGAFAAVLRRAEAGRGRGIFPSYALRTSRCAKGIVGLGRHGQVLVGLVDARNWRRVRVDRRATAGSR